MMTFKKWASTLSFFISEFSDCLDIVSQRNQTWYVFEDEHLIWVD